MLTLAQFRYQSIDSITAIANESEKKYFIEICAGKLKHPIETTKLIIGGLYRSTKEFIELMEEDSEEGILLGGLSYSLESRVLNVYTDSFPNFAVREMGMCLGMRNRSIRLFFLHHIGKDTPSNEIRIKITLEQALEFMKSCDDLGI